MPELKILGGAVLEADGKGVTGPAARRHPLALLALLAIAQSNTLSRERIIALLWPDANASVGRNRLTSTLYLIRRQLGSDVLSSSGEGIQLDRKQVSCDVWRFSDAVSAGDTGRAIDLYAGPLLDGFYIDDSLPFEECIGRHREQLHAQWRGAIKQLATAAESGGDYNDAVKWWKRLADDDPLSSAAVRKLARAHAGAGHTKNAVDVIEAHASRLHREIGTSAEAAFRESVANMDLDVAPDARVAVPHDQADSGIAVLPFDALAGSEDRVLAEGVHSGVLTRLSGIEGLGVIANTSLRRFLDSSLSVPEIAGELGVRWVLEGDVQSSGKQFRVCVRLVDATVNRQVWGHEYVAELVTDSFFTVLANISGAIIEKLKARLPARTESKLEKHPTHSLEAYRLCVRGRLRLDQRGSGDMQTALGHFEKAVEIDPGYALAWIGIADAIGLMHAYGYADAEELPRAEAAIRKALESDPDCAEAHAALGRLLGQRNQSVEAMREMRLATKLKPAYADAFAWMTIGLQFGGDIAGAVKSSRSAVRLNPLSPEPLNNLCSSYLFAGRYADAVRVAEDAEDLDDNYDSVQFLGAIARYEMRQYRDALDELELLNVPWAGSGVQTVMAACHAESGRPDAAKKLLAPIRAARHEFDAGVVLAALCEYEAAETAFDNAIFDGLDFATSYWPTVAVRYLFKRIWEGLPNAACRESMLSKIDALYGL